MAIQTKTMRVKSDTALADTTTTIRDTVTFDTSKLPNGITYKGLKAVLSFADPIQWNKASTYDSLTVVWDDATHASYASKRPVPQNIELTNEFYWFRTADLDAQVEQYRQEVQEMDGRVTANTNAIAAETERATNAEQTLRENISTEKIRAESAEQLLQANIDKLSYYVTPEMFGAYGDGVHDDTEAIQQALNHSRVIFGKDKTYLHGNVVIGKSNSIIDGNNSIHKFNSHCNLFSLAYKELKNVEICNFIVQGLITNEADGNSFDDAFIAENSDASSNWTNIKIHNNKVSNTSIGVSVNTNLAGNFKNIYINDNTFENIYGYNSGHGYAIHVACQSQKPQNVNIYNNTGFNVGRHFIYIGRCVDVDVHDNYANSCGKQDTSNAAISVSRSHYVNAHANFIENHKSYITMIADTDTGAKSSHILFDSNTIIGTDDVIARMSCMYLEKNQDIQYIKFINNLIIKGIIEIVTGEYITVESNTIVNEYNYGIFLPDRKLNVNTTRVRLINNHVKARDYGTRIETHRGVDFICERYDAAHSINSKDALENVLLVGTTSEGTVVTSYKSFNINDKVFNA